MDWIYTDRNKNLPNKIIFFFPSFNFKKKNDNFYIIKIDF